MGIFACNIKLCWSSSVTFLFRTDYIAKVVITKYYCYYLRETSLSIVMWLNMKRTRYISKEDNVIASSYVKCNTATFPHH